MQLMIGGDESPRLLRLASQFLLDAAQIAETEVPAAPGPNTDTVAETFAKMASGIELPLADIKLPAPPTAAEAFGAKPVNAAPPPPVVPPSPGANAAAGGAAPFSPGSMIAAPIAADALSPTTARTSDVDADGFPHDQRIHSVTPTRKADGRWRQRRNLDPVTLRNVEAELRAKGYGVLAPIPVATVSLPFVAPPPPPVVAGTDAPAPTVMVPPPPPVDAGVQSGADAFRTMMTVVGNHGIAGGRLSPEVMKPIHAEFGATGWGDYIGKCRDKIPEMIKRLETLLA